MSHETDSLPIGRPKIYPNAKERKSAYYLRHRTSQLVALGGKCVKCQYNFQPLLRICQGVLLCPNCKAEKDYLKRHFLAPPVLSTT